MWVVKLGGSLAQSAHLPYWLEALANTGAVIVPGGGPFADTVRKTQAYWHFGDRYAHHMAILAMNQYGRMLMGICPSLLAACGVADFRRMDGRASVWLPTPYEIDSAGIPANWDVTSDSLAAWLAGQVKASHLLLVKSLTSLAAGLAPEQIECKDAVNQRWVDTVFEEYGAMGPFQCWICGPERHARLIESMVSPARHFTRIHWN